MSPDSPVRGEVIGGLFETVADLQIAVPSGKIVMFVAVDERVALRHEQVLIVRGVA